MTALVSYRNAPLNKENTTWGGSNLDNYSGSITLATAIIDKPPNLTDMETHVRPPEYKFIVAMFNWQGMTIGLLLIGAGLLVEQYAPWEHRVAIGHFLAEVGAVWLALATLHMAYEWKMVGRIVQVVRRDAETMRVCDELGIMQILHKLPAQALEQPMALAKKRIRILKTFFPEDESFVRLLRTQLEKSSPIVELYLLEPGSTILDKRSKSLIGGETLKARDKVIQAIQEYCDCVGNRRHRIVLFDGWPGSPLVQCDTAVYVGNYFIGSASPYQPWTLVGKGSGLYRDLENQFNIIETKMVTHVISDAPSARAFLDAYRAQESAEALRALPKPIELNGFDLSGKWTFSVQFEPSKNISNFEVDIEQNGTELKSLVKETKTFHANQAQQVFHYQWSGHFRDRLATLAGRSTDKASLGAHTVMAEVLGSGDTLDCAFSRYCYTSNRINTSIVQWTRQPRPTRPWKT